MCTSFLCRLTAKASFEIAMTLKYQWCDRSAIFIFQKIIDLFGQSTDAPTAAFVAKSLMQLGFHYEWLEQREKAITFYDEVIHRYSDFEEGELPERVASALYNKGYVLEQQQPEMALKAYNEIIRRFGKSQETYFVDLLEVIGNRLSELNLPTQP